MEVVVPKEFQQTVDSTAPFRNFKCVFIPADPSEPMKEETIFQLPDRALSAMLDFAKERFSKTKLSAEGIEDFKAHLKKEHASATDDMAKKLAELTMCEVVPLLPHTRRTNFIAVNLVVDDKAVSKRLPLNERVNAICTRCGLILQVRGDAFICRQFDNDEGFYRLDFTLVDLGDTSLLSPDNPPSIQTDTNWIDLAKALRLEDAPGLERVAKQYKDQGNEYFKYQKYREAIWRYRQALSTLPDSRTPSVLEIKSQILSNESACKLKIGDAHGALAAADACLAVRPNWNKAWGRRGEALKALNRLAEAKEALDKVGLPL